LDISTAINTGYCGRMSINQEAFKTEPAALASRAYRTLPAIASLLYPGLVWCGPAVYPPLLLMSFLPPVLCFVAARRLGVIERFPLASRVAYFGVGAPALFTFLGGWLDSQKALPFHRLGVWNSVGVWILLWAALALAVFLERPSQRPERSPARSRTRLAFVHGVSATLLVAFVLVHLLNHLLGAWSGSLHIAFMTAARVVYRFPLFEATLAIFLLFQMGSGLALLWRKLGDPITSWRDTLRAASGAYLALFLLSHLSAVFRAHYLRHVDTNWIWLTSDNLLTSAWSARLVPYYFLSIVAFGAHVSCALHRVLLGHEVKETLADRAFSVIAWSTGAGAVIIMTGLIGASMKN
jgi:hypothetical protein